MKLTIEKAILEEIKDENGEGVTSENFEVFPGSDIEYYLAIYPNGAKDENRGQAQYFLFIVFDNKKEVCAAYNIFIGSPKYSMSRYDTYAEHTGGGDTFCTTEELFNPLNGYFIDGKLNIIVDGIITVEEKNRRIELLPPEINANESVNGEKDFTIIVDAHEIKVCFFTLFTKKITCKMNP